METLKPKAGELSTEGNTAMEQLISKLSTDAHNTAHSVLGMLELIAEDPLSRRQREYVHVCRSSIDSLLRTVEDVGELVNPDSLEIEQIDFDLHEAVTAVAGLMESLARKKGLEFDFTLRGDGPVWVSGDKTRIEDLLVRLLDSVIRGTHRGAVRFSCAYSMPNGGAPSMEFEICAKDADGDPSASKARAGLDESGLDLPIARRLVERMGGKIAVNASGGVTCGMRIAIPFTGACGRRTLPAGESVPELASTAAHVRPLDLLVAEDSDDSYILIEAYLRDQGHRLTRAADGAQAVELFKAKPFDIVFMDIRMPIVDGYTATRAMRDWETEAGHGRTPIVVLSAEETATQKRIGATVGCTAYLRKPVSKHTLLAAIGHYAIQ